MLRFLHNVVFKINMSYLIAAVDLSVNLKQEGHHVVLLSDGVLVNWNQGEMYGIDIVFR